jgi:hypothetical protein
MEFPLKRVFCSDKVTFLSYYEVIKAILVVGITAPQIPISVYLVGHKKHFLALA